MENETITATKVATKGYGATGDLIGGKKLIPMNFEREAPKENEVLIDILYCGICHSDIHVVENGRNNTLYPCVPGHEIIGEVAFVGSTVTKFKVGDIVGVGALVNSCKTCSACSEGDEQYCERPQGPTMTYNGYYHADGSGFNTYGGYSTKIVVREDFVLKIPDSLDIKRAAPILCAGITTYYPLKKWAVQEGDKIAVVGIGGLGHMAVMIAKAMGAEVTAVTTTKEKRQEATSLGADYVIVSTNDAEMKAFEKYFNYILITIPEPFKLAPYLALMKYKGSLSNVGLLDTYKDSLNNMLLAAQGISIESSLVGGINETQEVLNFCAEHNILPEVELISADEINEAYKQIKDKEVRYRFVIDMQTLR